MSGIISKICELQKKVCNYERALGDLMMFAKNKEHRFIQYEDESGLVEFLYVSIKNMHDEIDTLNTALSESVKREEIARKVIDQKRKEK